VRRELEKPTMWGYELPTIPGFTILSKQGEGEGLLHTCHTVGPMCYTKVTTTISGFTIFIYSMAAEGQFLLLPSMWSSAIDHPS
jgi:hypothetical protein